MRPRETRRMPLFTCTACLPMQIWSKRMCLCVTCTLKYTRKWMRNMWARGQHSNGGENIEIQSAIAFAISWHIRNISISHTRLWPLAWAKHHVSDSIAHRFVFAFMWCISVCVHVNWVESNVAMCRCWCLHAFIAYIVSSATTVPMNARMCV